MKKRIQFVSNSSSSSFILVFTNNSDKSIDMNQYIKDNFIDIYMEVLGIECISGIPEYLSMDEEDAVVFENKDLKKVEEYLADNVNMQLDVEMTLEPNEQAIINIMDDAGCSLDYTDLCLEIKKIENDKTKPLNISTAGWYIG